MKPRLAVVWAPSHADADVRVRRTVDVLAERFDEVHVFWDQAYPGHRRAHASAGTPVRERYIARGPGGWMAGLRSVARLPDPVAEAVDAADVVYLHASGIEGLLGARAARRRNPGCRIVFDYHDSLSFELDYQLRKRGVGAFFRAAWIPYCWIVARLSRAADAVVGISERQISELQSMMGHSVEAVVVPNVRRFTADIRGTARAAPVEGAPVSLVWFGQVMAGRDLNRIADWMAAVRGVRLHVFGNVLHEEMVAVLEARLADRVLFHGEYKCDADLAARLPANPVGVFLGWEDDRRTGINRIASPNKYFTYMNLEVPIIVHRRLEGLAEELAAFRAGLAVADQGEFVDSLERLGRSYAEYARGMTELKTERARRPPEDVLRELIGRLFRGAACRVPLGDREAERASG